VSQSFLRVVCIVPVAVIMIEVRAMSLFVFWFVGRLTAPEDPGEDSAEAEQTDSRGPRMRRRIDEVGAVEEEERKYLCNGNMNLQQEKEEEGKNANRVMRKHFRGTVRRWGRTRTRIIGTGGRGGEP
jgi:hypothetical protein